eukprot:TRINITY_DN18960_c0_g1_i3.p1 TRINITY_DN18960_c0_g1~~TRINITY_DN18960_c0_g1_i3.p1  ORF type:complete len:614 (+),score=148.35 TRINITY_DN18960_c0_g1_i3:99-1940(+)
MDLEDEDAELQRALALSAMEAGMEPEQPLDPDIVEQMRLQQLSFGSDLSDVEMQQLLAATRETEPGPGGGGRSSADASRSGSRSSAGRSGGQASRLAAGLAKGKAKTKPGTPGGGRGGGDGSLRQGPNRPPRPQHRSHDVGMEELSGHLQESSSVAAAMASLCNAPDSSARLKKYAPVGLGIIAVIVLLGIFAANLSSSGSTAQEPGTAQRHRGRQPPLTLRSRQPHKQRQSSPKEERAADKTSEPPVTTTLAATSTTTTSTTTSSTSTETPSTTAAETTTASAKTSNAAWETSTSAQAAQAEEGSTREEERPTTTTQAAFAAELAPTPVPSPPLPLSKVHSHWAMLEHSSMSLKMCLQREETHSAETGWAVAAVCCLKRRDGGPHAEAQTMDTVDSSDACSMGVNHEDAEKFCRSRGLRLCDLEDTSESDEYLQMSLSVCGGGGQPFLRWLQSHCEMSCVSEPEIEHMDKDAMSCGGTVSGKACPLECETGYISSSGDAGLLCDGGRWSKVECRPQRCEGNPDVANIDEEASNCSGTGNGESCKFKCKIGYIASGKASCEHGNWLPATCDPTPCYGDPGIVHADRSAWSCDGTPPGGSCTFSCQEGQSASRR